MLLSKPETRESKCGTYMVGVCVQDNVRVRVIMCIGLLHKCASKYIIAYFEVDEVVIKRTGGFK